MRPNVRARKIGRVSKILRARAGPIGIERAIWTGLAEYVWIMTDFLYEVGWQEGHPTHKISFVSLYSELKVLKPATYPLPRKIIRDAKRNLTQFSRMFNVIFIIVAKS